MTDGVAHDDRFMSPTVLRIGEHAPYVPPYDRMLQRTGDAFKETDHPRGQPDNAGQFAKSTRTRRARQGQDRRSAPGR